MPSAHGTRTRYNKGCRCVECRQANMEYNQAHPGPKRAGMGMGRGQRSTDKRILDEPDRPLVAGGFSVKRVLTLDGDWINVGDQRGRPIGIGVTGGANRHRKGEQVADE